MLKQTKISRIFVFYGHMASNIGDLAINAGEIVLLRNSFPDASINIIFFGSKTNKYIQDGLASFGPDIDTVFTFIPSPNKALKFLSDPRTFLEHCGAQNADLIILASGEHLFSYKHHHNIDAIFWRSLPILAAKLLSKRVILLPSTFGPFEVDQSSELVCQALQVVDDFAVRDLLSKQYIQSLGFHNNPPLLLDPAFFIDLVDLQDYPVNETEEYIVPKGHLAVVMRSEFWGIRLSREQLKSTSDKRSDIGYKSSLAFEFIKKLSERFLSQTDQHIVLYVQTLADEKLAKSFLTEYSNDINKNRIQLYRPKSVKQYIECLARSNFVVASRFHAIILAIIIEKPVHGVYFDIHGHKIAGLFEMIDEENLYDLLTKNSIDTVVEKVFTKIQDMQKLPEKTQKRLATLRQATLAWLTGNENRTADPGNIMKLWYLLGDYSSEHFLKKLETEQSHEETYENIPVNTGELEKKKNEIEQTLKVTREFVNLLVAEKSYKESFEIVSAQANELSKDKKEIEQTLKVTKEHMKILMHQDRSLKKTTTYKFGKQIIKDVKRPHHWPLLPIKLLRIYQKNKKQPSKISKDQLEILNYLNIKGVDPINPVPKRVCYILHNSLPYASGGYATRAHGLSLGLLQNGYEVMAVTRPGFPLDTIKIDHTDITDSNIDGVHYSRIIYPKRKGISTAKYMKSTIGLLENRFRKIRPSIVIAASFYITALPAIIAARRVGIPVIYELRGLAEVTKMSRDKKYKRTDDYNLTVRMETETANSADHIFTLTSGMQDELVRRGVPGNKITILPNSCNADQFTPLVRNSNLAKHLDVGSNVPVIGYIGTLVDYEGLDDLIQACGLLKSQGLEFRLLIVGSEESTGSITGPITEGLKKIAKSIGLDDWLIMPGRVPHKEVMTYYSLIDIAPFPRKPWPVCEMVSPMKPLEALSMEKAVIVSSVKALTDMISNGDTGLVFEKGNIKSLASALQILIVDVTFRSSLGKRGKEFVRAERNWKTTAKKSIPILKKVTSQLPKQEIIRSRSNEPVHHPAWWPLIDSKFAKKCACVIVNDWELSTAAIELRKIYVNRFDEESIKRRVPLSNWKRADICWQMVPNDLPTIDIGSGLGEFVNLFSTNNKYAPIASVDTRDWDKWFDSTGHIERIYKSIFELGETEARDVVTCFEVIEHLPPSRVKEAVTILRNLAQKKLFVSVPFLEPPPMYKGHFTRFTEKNLSELFPDAKFTVFAKSMNSREKVHAWILCEVDI
ncbi:polysaccharide pyruvyl transferase family protein [Microbulbifer sp. 2205BS26-8]|uniref:polysaccharide pyruvyl transferase family protein n=1 Tax=Microbulbifer sp. 2205BS26-8 TaxID=3064386 RepID=UPI00273D7D46|nr:polysaccharide pyruvyl transferase family protein [Microbulbifer sp. 2205BS26-8]MDP5211234.1 polysaccharide pyruvyl transferase family protein [Microbulbifer sp. 2205BS26-8]